MNNLKLEEIILNSILKDNDLYYLGLNERLFNGPNKVIFRIIENLIDNNVGVDYILLENEMIKQNHSIEYLLSLKNIAFSSSKTKIKEYVNIEVII